MPAYRRPAFHGRFGSRANTRTESSWLHSGVCRERSSVVVESSWSGFMTASNEAKPSLAARAKTQFRTLHQRVLPTTGTPRTDCTACFFRLHTPTLGAGDVAGTRETRLRNGRSGRLARRPVAPKWRKPFYTQFVQPCVGTEADNRGKPGLRNQRNDSECSPRGELPARFKYQPRTSKVRVRTSAAVVRCLKGRRAGRRAPSPVPTPHTAGQAGCRQSSPYRPACQSVRGRKGSPAMRG
jgi:hypothetical protein